MRTARHWAAAAMLCAPLLAACHPPHTREAEFYVFGTLVEVTLADVDEKTASHAFGELQQAFQRMHQDWHSWEPGRLTAINRAFAEGRPIEADPDIVAMVRAAQVFERQTAGCFNPAIGRLVALWGFHTSDYPIYGPAPAASAIRELVAQHPSTSSIDIRETTLFDRSAQVQLDFGGLAKGFAVDRAGALLYQLGIHNALINAGGDLRGFGSRGDRPWRVGIRNPLGGVIGTIDLRGGEAVFTSGNYERFRVDQREKRYPHILDPRTGWPAEEIMSATVITDNGMQADAAATALVVAGLDEWREVAAGLGISAVLLTDEPGRIYATPAMRERLSLSAGLSATELTPP